LIANTKIGIVKLKGELEITFPMKDLGEMQKILGIKIDRDREKGTLTMSQGHYTDIILAHFNMSKAHLVSTPLHKAMKLTGPLDQSGPSTEVPYAKAIGSLMYAALSSRPDLAFTVQHLSQFTTTYGLEHWTVVKHVLSYLQGSRDDRITFNSFGCANSSRNSE
jgi:hypothetical protein